MSQYLDDVIRYGPSPRIAEASNANTFTVVTTITNADKQAHTFNAQANLYDVPLKSLGADPDQHLIGVGTVHLTLAAGEIRTVAIPTKTWQQAVPLSVNFLTVGT